MPGFCDSSQSSNNGFQYADPLGPSSLGPRGKPTYTASGAPQMRSQIFNYLGSAMPAANQAGADYASALKTAASNPGYQAAADVAQKNISGDYLNGSPQLDRALAATRSAGQAEAANETARVRSEYGKDGMGFSTAAQQADQAARASATATASRANTGAYLQNYLAERGNQNAGGQMLTQATSTPLNYLQQVSGARMAPLSQAGSLITGMSTGGQNLQTSTNGQYNPSTGANILNGLGGL